MSRHDEPWSVLELERSEQRAHRYYDTADDDRERYDPADDRKRTAPPYDPYMGTCGGCGGYVSASLPGGACMWRPPGPWHPACRRADKDAGGTRTTPPA